MQKKVLAAVVLAGLCLASVAGATPMTEFHKGKGQVSVSAWHHDASIDNALNPDFGSKWGFNGDVTYGVAEKWGVQYRYHNLSTGEANAYYGIVNYSGLNGNEHELNVLYSFDPNAAAYVGWHRIHADGSANVDLDDNHFTDNDSATNNVAQIGVVAKTELAKNLNLYGNFALGTKSTVMGEAGLGYTFTPDWDVNVGYRYLKTDLGSTVKWKGFMLGVSYKFGK